MTKKIDVVLINKSFWPESPVIGKGLLEIAEKLSLKYEVLVITQSKLKLKAVMVERKNTVIYRCLKCRTTTKSSILVRAVESLFFMVWVLYSLIVARPKKVYVSTNPPIFVPFIVSLYCKFSGVKLIYHLQDIHPEATNSIFSLNKYIFSILQMIDNFSVRNSALLITLTSEMNEYLMTRTKNMNVKVVICQNPSIDSSKDIIEKSKDIVFCGNIGRAQRIPLLVKSIKEYCDEGGNLKFSFVGDGFLSNQIEELSCECENVNYLGYLMPEKASNIIRQHYWALLPIDDEITKYAFPSKSSTYAMLGCNIIAICSKSTSVAKWIDEYELGYTLEPRVEDLTLFFKQLESDNLLRNRETKLNYELVRNLCMTTYVERISDLIDNL